MGLPVEVDGDAYRMQRRPGHSQVIINVGERGLRIVDPWTGWQSETIVFTPAFATSGAVTQWCIRADGGAAFVINGETRAGCFVTLDGTVRHDVEVPFDAIRDVRYVWRGEDLWVTFGPGRPFGRLEWAGDVPHLAAVSRVRVHAANPAWYQALRLLPGQCTVERVESARDRMLLHENSVAVGVVSWFPAPAVRMMPFTGGAPRVACFADVFFVMDEFAIRVVDEYDESVIPVEDGFEFVDVDVVDASDGHEPVLVALGISLGSPHVGRIWRFPLLSRSAEV